MSEKWGQKNEDAPSRRIQGAAVSYISAPDINRVAPSKSLGTSRPIFTRAPLKFPSSRTVTNSHEKRQPFSDCSTNCPRLPLVTVPQVGALTDRRTGR